MRRLIHRADRGASGDPRGAGSGRAFFPDILPPRFLLLFPLLFLCVFRGGAETPPDPPESERIRICTFNIQVFGVSKMSKPRVPGMLADIVSRFDLIAVQEVRSARPEPVERFMTLLPERYGYVLGPREGRSSSREQFWIIYDTEKLTVLGVETWPDPQDCFERNPLGVYFQTKGKFDFILVDVHVRPDSAAEEIAAMPELAAGFRNLWQEEDLLLVGDFNADGSYYDETALSTVFPGDEYLIVTGNDLDTTVAAGDNSYDRIIISSSALEDYAFRLGVLRFEEHFDFDALPVRPGELSDHYPVWAEFFIDRDTD
jgi:endonuclease/exonuclease/phosphatase family metal-dependent hydrolase